MTTAHVPADVLDDRATPPDDKTPRARRRLPWWIMLATATMALAGVAYALPRAGRAPPTPHYLSARVTHGDLDETIRSTGTVQPVLQVQVGAQVSGRVLTVPVDFNSRVRRGDLLAEIDATPYRAQVAQARAALVIARAATAQSRANLRLAEQNLTRAQRLRERDLNAQSDLEQASAQCEVARAAVQVAAGQVEQASASLQTAETNLSYTRIYAPIDGTVATRSVDPGQTVAASFQTPTLFVIANDLTHMQVLADVDEANIGKLREGMAAEVRVEAFPREIFRGVIVELRITPTTTNGVVTYASVINVENPARELRPGMTATITMVTEHRAGVLSVPNAALRYHPSAALARAAAAAGPTAPRSALDSGVVYVVRGAGPAARVPVTVGISDGLRTEVGSTALHPGDRVVLDETDAAPVGAGVAPRGRMF